MEKSVAKWLKKGKMAGMILGTYKPKLISERRIALPGKIKREIKGKRIVLTVGFEKCILGFEEKKWGEVTASDLARPLSDTEGRNLRRKMFAEATVVGLGVQGRFVIPKRMQKYAGIKNEITLIGAGDHFEIWDPVNWQKYKEKNYGSS